MSTTHALSIPSSQALLLAYACRLASGRQLTLSFTPFESLEDPIWRQRSKHLMVRSNLLSLTFLMNFCSCFSVNWTRLPQRLKSGRRACVVCGARGAQMESPTFHVKRQKKGKVFGPESASYSIALSHVASKRSLIPRSVLIHNGQVKERYLWNGQF